MTTQKRQAFLNSLARGCSDDITNIEIKKKIEKPTLPRSTRILKWPKPK